MQHYNSAARRHGPRLLRTSQVRLALTFGIACLGGLVLLNSVIFWNAARYLQHQGDGIVKGQAKVLAALPLQRLPDRIGEAERGDLRGVDHFGLFDSQGRWVAGSIRAWPQQLVADGQPRALRLEGFQYGARAVGETLSNDYRLVVAYDAKTLTGLTDIVRRALTSSAILAPLLMLALGAVLGTGPLRRLRLLQQTSALIAAGDLTQRLPVTRVGDELDMLAEQVNQMIDQIQGLIEEVKSVGDNVAHDLRAPLGTLRAALVHCLQDWPQLDEQQRLADIERALGSADVLLARFRALQRVAMLDSRERHAGMRPCELVPLLDGLAESHEALAESVGLSFSYCFEPGTWVMADPELLAEAFINLLDNAFKFTPPGGQVQWRLWVEQGYAVIELADTGPGVEPQQLERVLERRVRGQHTHGIAGCGLGLAIVQAVVRVHGWRLQLQNRQPGPGLKVRLEAPVRA